MHHLLALLFVLLIFLTASFTNLNKQLFYYSMLAIIVANISIFYRFDRVAIVLSSVAAYILLYLSFFNKKKWKDFVEGKLEIGKLLVLQILYVALTILPM